VTTAGALLVSAAASAAINVVATTTSMGMIVRTVGGDRVRITVLAPPDRDAHYLQAKPNMILAVRRADLVVAVGAELEIGWLPAVLQSAANGRVLPGQPGYFEAAAQVDLIETGGPADRARGDVHPAGNPHVYMDPERMAKIARSLAWRLGQFEPGSATGFQKAAEAFGAAVAARVPGWKARVAGAEGALLYHKDANYLMAFTGVPVLGYIEPLPGIPPTASHLRDLVQRLKGRRGVILRDFGAWPNPEKLAYGKPGWPRTTNYWVRFAMDEIWGGAGAYAVNDAVVAEIYEHWLEPDTTPESAR
jgi:zinc/manganese transport system substrate-binding protein